MSITVNAATVTYDFDVRSPGINAFAYDGQIDANSFPPSNATTPSSQHSNSEYNAIARDDSSYDSYSVSQNGRIAIQRYVFEIDEVETDVTQLDILWNGAGQNAHNPRTDGAELYLWNYTTANYTKLDDSGDTSSVVNLEGSITSNISQYIGGAANNQVTILVASNDKRTGNRPNILYTDYVKLDVVSSGVGPGECTVADNFNNISYSQNDGSIDWIGSWQEIGEADGPSSGIARVRNDNCSSGNCLRLGVPSGGGAQTYSNIGVAREVDLSTASSATLTFNYRTGYSSGTPLVRLWASNDGGITWFFVQQYSFFSTNFTATAQTIDLTPYISSNTQIRFLADGAGAVSGFYIDDIQISYDCSEVVTNFQIRHDGKGLTCAPEPVEIVACSDATCSSVNTSINTDVTLMVNGGGAQTVTLNNGVSSGVSFNYSDTVTPATLSLSGDFICSDSSDGSADCSVDFSNVGFVFSNIANQVSGEAFSDVKLSSLEDNGNGTCQALFANETKTIDLAMTYLNPSDTATLNDFTVDNVPIDKNLLLAAPNNFTGVSLNFNSQGEALITGNYFDAGQINLSARYVQPPNLPLQPGFTLEGDSNAFWVRPYQLTLETITLNPNGGTPINNSLFTTGATHKAAEPFAFIIKALNQSGGLTTNYVPSQSQLSVKRVAPVNVGTEDGDFTYATGESKRDTLATTFSDVNFTAFVPGNSTGGVSSFTGAKYSEVGVLELDVRDNNYGNQTGFHVEADAITVGRFTPAYLTQSVISHGELVTRDDSLVGTCGERDWAYSGQLNVNQLPTEIGAIRYSSANPPKIEILAFNQDGDLTKNYIIAATGAGGDSFMRLEPNDVVITPPVQDIKGAALAITANNPLDIDTSNAFSHLTGGVEYTLSDDDHFVYTHNNDTFLAPFTAEFDLDIDQIIDADGIAVDTSVMVAPLPYEHIEIRTGVQVRFGRLMLENSYGPETSDLAQHFKTEYLVNPLTQTFTTNVNDNCTAITNVGNLLSLSDIGEGLDDLDVNVVGNAGTMELGEFKGLDLRSASQGQIGVEYTTPAWLLFDWDENGTHDNNAGAIATFGQFRGNDRIIYWRESN
ncbi:DUF6701 domain-containing protein [Thalassotalea atypica]|uniref:DUF6701 domain-containing protein n=1 Tax=Thalassotalea atypica TaxID=2054316 RepID=UPI002572A1D3|nr:DUF6701 domain-containing protein [Thalassotalea atypica]